MRKRVVEQLLTWQVMQARAVSAIKAEWPHIEVTELTCDELRQLASTGVKFKWTQSLRVITRQHHTTAWLQNIDNRIIAKLKQHIPDTVKLILSAGYECDDTVLNLCIIV